MDGVWPRKVMEVIGCCHSRLVMHRTCVVTNDPGHKEEAELRGTVNGDEPRLQSL